MRTSFHSQQLQHSCALKYELTRVRDIGNVDSYVPEDKDANADLAYGKTIGAGFATLLATKDLDAAIFKAACVYSFWESDKKCFEGIVAALQVLKKEFPLHLYTSIKDEAAIKITLGTNPDTGEEDWWCGFIDLILRREDTGKYVIGEVKSCGLNRDDLSPLYQNSAQALGYSIALPHLPMIQSSEASFEAMYIVAHIPGQQWFPKIKTYIFGKTPLDRLRWLLNLQLDYEQYFKYREMSYWPHNGEACLSYNRPCPLFGLCHTLDPTDFPYREPDKIDLMKPEKWDIDISLAELINYEHNVQKQLEHI